MRRVFLLGTLVVAFGWLACTLPPAQELAESLGPDRRDRPMVDSGRSAAGAVTAWRRTVDGWERPSSWAPSEPTAPPALHPATLAAFLVLASLLGLIACPGGKKRRIRLRPS